MKIFIKSASLLVLASLNLVFFTTIFVQPENIKAILIFLALSFIGLPILISKILFQSFRTKLEFCSISWILTVVLSFAFVQINTRTDIVTSVSLLGNSDFSWSSKLALVLLSVVSFGIYFDLIFGRFITNFRLSFTSTFILQLISSLGFLSYLHLTQVSDFTQRYYKNVWVNALVNTPFWLITIIFATISSFITIFYFGRGNKLKAPRSTLSKIGWRVLITFIHLEITAVIIVLPQNYWWKVLFYLLIWDFIVIPLSRIYKQSTDFFWDRLKLSLSYHLVLFIIVFWISK